MPDGKRNGPKCPKMCANVQLLRILSLALSGKQMLQMLKNVTNSFSGRITTSTQQKMIYNSFSGRIIKF